MPSFPRSPTQRGAHFVDAARKTNGGEQTVANRFDVSLCRDFETPVGSRTAGLMRRKSAAD